MKVITHLVFGWVGAVLVPASVGLALEPAVIQRCSDATVLVRVERTFLGKTRFTSASGFFATPRGVVITNWHAVSPMVEVFTDAAKETLETKVIRVEVVVRAGTSAERTLPASVVANDPDVDLALLAVDTSPTSWLDLAKMGNPGMTEEVWAFGYPFGDLLALGPGSPEITVTRGHVTSLRHGTDGSLELVQLDAAINPGNSGGPVVGGDGSVVGLAWARVSAASNTAFAIAPPRLSEFARQHRVRLTLTPPAAVIGGEPVLARVQPLLGEIGTARCDLELRVAGFAPTSTVLTPRNEECEGSFRVPAAWKNATTGVLRLRLVAAGAPALDREFSLPLITPGAPVGSRSAASAVTPWDLFPDPTPTPRQAASLSDLARSVRIKKSEDSGAVVLNNEALREGAASLDPSRYDFLTSDDARAAARQFDLLEFEYRGSRRQSSDSYNTTTPATGDTKRAEALAQRLREAAALVGRLRLCRCSNGQWQPKAAAHSCQDCKTPTAPQEY